MRLVAPDKLEIDARRLVYSQDSRLNIEIKPFDTISVSRADIVYVVGAVRKAGGFVMQDRENLTVLQAVALAEGLTWSAAKRGARIIRRHDDGSRTEIPLDLGKIWSGKSQDVEMAANDILFIPTSKGKLGAARGAESAIGLISGLLIYGRL
jgi:polysaccharide export outer membrane protein